MPGRITRWPVACRGAPRPFFAARGVGFKGYTQGVQLVIDLLTALMSTAEGSPEDNRNTPAHQAAHLFHIWFKTDLSVASVARDLNVSPEHLSREFKREFGPSPQEYLAQMRVRRAAQLLRETTLPHKTILEQCGFDTPSTFYRVFEQHMGTTPRQYRNSQLDRCVVCGRRQVQRLWRGARTSTPQFHHHLGRLIAQFAGPGLP